MLKKDVIQLRNSEAGFSLIELMIVVAIIGILAAIAIPNYTRFQEKAKQSEARGNLQGIYTAEKSIYADQTTYLDRFDAIGFNPEGQLTYRVGFTSNVGTPTGYSGPTGSGGCNSTQATAGTCAGFPAGQGVRWFETTAATTPGALADHPVNTATITCMGPGSVPVTDYSGAVVTGPTGSFSAVASAQISNTTGAWDGWGINDGNIMCNTTGTTGL